MSCAADGDLPPQISVEQFARPAERGAISFSPDGKHFAAIAESKGRLGLDVIDDATKKGTSYYSDVGSDVVWFRWLTNDMLELRTAKIGTRQSDLWGRDFAWMYVSISGKSAVGMFGGVSVLRNVPGSETDLIVERDGWLEIRDSITGEIKKRLVESVPGPRKLGWVLDKTLALRAAWSWSRGTGKTEVWWRDNPQGPWRSVFAFDRKKERGFYPVAMDSDGNLLVLSNLATGYFALHRFDPTTGRPGELLVGLPGADMSGDGLIYGLDRIDPVGVQVGGDKPQTYWFDDARDRVQRTIDASLPKSNVNDLEFLPSGKVLVRSYGPADPGSYFFYDPAAKTLSQWVRVKTWIDPRQMGVTTVMHYPARDGQDIPAYLTLPRGRPGHDLPLMVWVHGGPHERDRWAFDEDVQLFANRGYAVLQANFRGSTGLGDAFMRSGNGQWGRAMEDDLVDGVRALIAKGVVDAHRVCIGGASYGGYAALMGLIKEPGLFRCAIDYAGPTDLIWFVELAEADYNRGFDADVDRDLKEIAGNPDDAGSRRVMEENSPRLLAQKIKAPVLMLYGTADNRVPLKHGDAMRSALESAGATFEWKTYAGEGHGVYDTANKADLLRTMGTFLERYDGAQSPPTADAASR